MEENIVVIRGLKIFYFDFDWPKGSDENFKHKIEFVIKSIEPVAENKKKIQSKYKNVNSIYKDRKQ